MAGGPSPPPVPPPNPPYGPPPSGGESPVLPVIVGGDHGDPQMTAQEKAELAGEG